MKTTKFENLENFIFQFVSKAERELLLLAKNKSDYSKQDYIIKFHMLHAQIDALYMLLTGYDNILENLKIIKPNV